GAQALAVADAGRGADQLGLAVDHSEHVLFRTHLHAGSGADALVLVDPGVKRDRLGVAQPRALGVDLRVTTPELGPAHEVEREAPSHGGPHHQAGERHWIRHGRDDNAIHLAPKLASKYRRRATRVRGAWKREPAGRHRSRSCFRPRTTSSWWPRPPG